MHRRLVLSACALLCLSAILSCEKEEKPLLPEQKIIDFDAFLGLSYFFPELENTPSVQYDNEMGYYIPFDHKEWIQHWSCGSVFISPQSSSFTAKARRVEDEDFSGWSAQDVSYTILSDIHIPEQASELVSGDCPSVIKLHVALGENVPYRKVTLEDFSVRFPQWFYAELAGIEFGSIRELVVPAEGVDLNIGLSGISFLSAPSFVDKEGKLCYSIETTFEALVTASPEDAIGPISGNPSELDFNCTLEFSQIDFTSCILLYKDISFPETTFTWNPAELPSFLCGEKSKITFNRPRILIEYQNDFPFYQSALHVAALNDDKKAEFSVTSNVKCLYMPHEDGNYRENIFNISVPTLETIFNSPFSDGKLSPSISFQPVSSEEGMFTPGQEYQMQAKADLMVPLAFTGELDVEAIPTPPLVFDGRSLGAPGKSTHQIRQSIGCFLPFECRITPVFTMKGEDPVFLDSFIHDKVNRVTKIIYDFHPSEDDWEATFHYLITPLRGNGEFLKNTDFNRVEILDTRIITNIPTHR